MTGKLLLLLATVALLPGASVAADQPGGEAELVKCKICHSLNEGGDNRVGPNLHGLFGRKAGTFPDFAFSDAMKASGIVWSDETLAKFLRDPKASLPGNRMAFVGIKDEAVLSDLLQRLRDATR